MSTRAEPVDVGRLESSIALVRSDAGDIYRKSWVLVGHVDNNPLSIDVVASSDTEGGEATLEAMCAALRADQVMYGLLRLTTAFDLSTTIKFIYIHWSPLLSLPCTAMFASTEWHVIEGPELFLFYFDIHKAISTKF